MRRIDSLKVVLRKEEVVVSAKQHVSLSNVTCNDPRVRKGIGRRGGWQEKVRVRKKKRNMDKRRSGRMTHMGRLLI